MSSDRSGRDGEAKIKPEFLVKQQWGSFRGDAVKVDDDKDKEDEEEGESPVNKKPRVEDQLETVEGERGDEGDESNSKSKGHKGRGQNKNRPAPPKYSNADKLCPSLLDGPISGDRLECARKSLEGNARCPFVHDIDEYLESKKERAEGPCYIFEFYGKCSRGLTCLFADSHVDSSTKTNIVNQEKWLQTHETYEQTHRQLLSKEMQTTLRKHKFDFKMVDKLYSNNVPSASDKKSTLGAVTDEDQVMIRPSEMKKLDWNDKLYLSPLTTVGNLPFRRLCVEMGADITCSEMSLSTSILQGNPHEFALHRRHPSEKMWGVQLCASNGNLAAKAAHAIAECGIDYDFVDLNMGCPLDAIYRQGAGSGLMCRANKFHSFVRGMTSVLSSKNKPFTVKMRTGIKVDKNIAHSLIEFCKDNGVAAVTLHGRSREQRYLKYADWNYIGECAKVASPMPLFGNGDILSWEDYMEKKQISNVTGVMIGRGALIKPWIFQEIKEQRHIDLTSSERLDLIRKYCNYGLDHWGSDSQGVAATRRFLLEWMSFFHRYIPYGILEEPPQRINHRPPKYVGRDEMETLLASSNSVDWVKISEMFLGPVPDNFQFIPKHRANAWSNG